MLANLICFCPRHVGDMRKPGEWMAHPDVYILEYLDERGPAAPSKIYRDTRLPFAESYVGNRCRTLADHRFVRNLGNGTYQITERGEEWLDGEFDAATLDDGDQGKATA